MARIKGSLGKSISEQHVIFDALNYDPHEDDGNDEYGGTFHSLAMPMKEYCSRRQDCLEDPYYFGICNEQREDEIKAGQQLTKEEEHNLTKEIFGQHDTYMVPNIFTDGQYQVHGLTVQQSQGQLGIKAIDFLGFYSTDEEIERAIELSSYYVCEPV